MATNVVALTQLANLGDVETDIKNTIDARERLRVLYATLTDQRKNAATAFLRAFSVALVAVKGDPDRAFMDAQFTQFTAWKTADEDASKRIVALDVIAIGLKNRIAEFESANRDEFIDLLQRQIAVLNEQLQKQEADEDALKERIKALNDELGRLLPGAKVSAAGAKKSRR